MLVRSQFTGKLGTGDISATISYNALGQGLTRLGELEEAERNIQNVLTIAINFGSRENEGLYRENFAMVYESSGNLRKARMTREMNAPDKFVCSYYKDI
ncbi:hypothetical protein PHLGIDRAFT_113997 [Phlebiopsis gigantea 11061_1 CR5-6]|uniref:MalT-like TPR region domain-containing protein n=1 Tax=Phlebiopsis gigantea (strain 11061_1 CR5-6) TaxID=745531 RepID=A0A0C3S6N1_PHLG1|nr:hypothetical protein PHLGIDRAFT_113997 [Phlebiopsis gigantea 11061_1 CR5-6]